VIVYARDQLALPPVSQKHPAHDVGAATAASGYRAANAEGALVVLLVTRENGNGWGRPAYRYRPHPSLARPRGRHPFTSQPHPLSQEPESPGTAAVVEVGLDTLTLIVEGLMVIASLVGATLVPSLLLVPSRLVASTAVPTVTALWGALAVSSAWRRVMPRVGGRRTDAGAQPGETEAKGERRRSGQMFCLHYQLLSETRPSSRMYPLGLCDAHGVCQHC
jgi:hypothetical protein